MGILESAGGRFGFGGVMEPQPTTVCRRGAAGSGVCFALLIVMPLIRPLFEINNPTKKLHGLTPFSGLLVQRLRVMMEIRRAQHYLYMRD